MPNTLEFRAFLRSKLAAAEAAGQASITVRAGDLHSELGGYPPAPGSKHQMPSCCAAMRSEMLTADRVLEEPPKGKGANLRIQYVLPRMGVDASAKAPLAEAARQEHQHALNALPVIAQAAITGNPITYEELAERLGLPKRYAHPMGQACDLLDCAATLARRPLMALWTVRNAQGEINPQAWKDTPGLREALIEQAANHTFTIQDRDAIGLALSKLRGMGRKKAWDRVREQIPHTTMLARLQEVPQPPDAVNDIGTDAPPIEIYDVQRYARDPAVRAQVLLRAQGLCEYCGKPGFERAEGGRYLECHHIIALANDGADRMSNVIALCAEDHRKAHFGIERDTMEKLMVDIVAGKLVQAKPAAR